MQVFQRARFRATDIAERLGLDFGLVHKERKKHEDVEPEVTFVGDVNGRVRGLVGLRKHYGLGWSAEHGLGWAVERVLCRLGSRWLGERRAAPIPFP